VLPDPELVKARLPAVAARYLHLVGEPRGLTRLTGGATKSTWIFDADLANGAQRFVLQLTTASANDDPQTRSKLTAAEDAQIMDAVRAAGVLVPPVYAVLDERDGLGSGHITGFVGGETLGPRILRESTFALARERLTEDCAQALARLHRIAPSAMPSLLPRDAGEQWQRYRAQVDAHGVKLPAIELGLRWVAERLPQFALPAAQLTLVHGDFRLGNLIVNEQGLACVIDWEIAGLGDPAQDLAWLSIRTWRFGGAAPVAGVGQREPFFQAYERAGGAPVDRSRVAFWEVFSNLKWAIMCIGIAMGNPGSDRRLSSLEHRAIGRRVEEPLWDMLELL
jgi:aminoglycoside phosphotransferase (APT) family kinase protein